MKKLLLISLATTGAFAEEAITQNDRFYDPALKDYVRVCEKNDDKYVVKRSCGKFEDSYVRNRNEIFKEIDSYKALKKGDTVMIKVNKNDSASWVLAQVSFLYENGDISVMEYYNKRFGFNTGTINRTVRYDQLIKSNDKVSDSEINEMCLESDYVLKYNYDNSREFELKKGEAVKVVQKYSNGYTAITLKNHTWDDFQGYGLNNKLPIESERLVACENSQINNDSISAKPVEKNTEKSTEAKTLSK